VVYPGDSFADQLICVIGWEGFGGLRKTAELARVHFQSLSRFIDESREEGAKQTGLEAVTLERLWSHFGLSIARTTGTGEIVWIASAAGFAEQLRESVRASGHRPARIAEVTLIPKSSLSLFLKKGTRRGLAFPNVEKLWSYLHLCITKSGHSLVSTSDQVSPTGPGLEMSDDDLDDLKPFIY
jgi:hypothetical protein